MSWNYRVLRRPEGWELVEVYYQEGKIFSWLDVEQGGQVVPSGNTYEELRQDLKLMLRAFNQPPLEEVMDEGEVHLREVSNWKTPSVGSATAGSLGS